MSQIPCIMYPARACPSDLKHGQRRLLSPHLLPWSCCNQALYSSKFSTAKPEISSTQIFLLCFYGENTINCKTQPYIWSASKSSQDSEEWASLARWASQRGVWAGKWTLICVETLGKSSVWYPKRLKIQVQLEQQNQALFIFILAAFLIFILADVPTSNEVCVQDSPGRNPEVLATDTARLSRPIGTAFSR